ncbi:hypothetical protein [Salibaculum sp.]|uniref:hypothetical protein n=1 Tax=Salibaculum sp. TaxID=2855480 RepID=UPI002B4599C0|nr:hypothetical protein [Salibaculum sp.]HKL68356.1 hypothetical protein [Salibaculum sp.]
MEWQQWVPLVTSTAAVIISAAFGLVTILDRRRSFQISREADLHLWVQKLAEIYCDLRSGDDLTKRTAAIELSTQIDYGRLIFPNETTKRAKAEYAKGLRSSVLDPLVETVIRANLDDWNATKIATDWREFTDQITARTTAFQVNTSPEASGNEQYRNP